MLKAKLSFMHEQGEIFEHKNLICIKMHTTQTVLWETWTTIVRIGRTGWWLWSVKVIYDVILASLGLCRAKWTDCGQEPGDALEGDGSLDQVWGGCWGRYRSLGQTSRGLAVVSKPAWAPQDHHTWYMYITSSYTVYMNLSAHSECSVRCSCYTPSCTKWLKGITVHCRHFCVIIVHSG